MVRARAGAGGGRDTRLPLLAGQRAHLPGLAAHRARADRRRASPWTSSCRTCAGGGGSGSRSALLAAGVLCSLRAVNHWVRCERAMRRGEDLPVSRFPALLSLVVALVAVAMVVVVLVGWDGVSGPSPPRHGGPAIRGCSRSGRGSRGGGRPCRAPWPRSSRRQDRRCRRRPAAPAGRGRRPVLPGAGWRSWRSRTAGSGALGAARRPAAAVLARAPRPWWRWPCTVALARVRRGAGGADGDRAASGPPRSVRSSGTVDHASCRWCGPPRSARWASAARSSGNVRSTCDR